MQQSRLRKNYVGSQDLRSAQQGHAPAGCSKRPSSKAAADECTGGVASGYVEDAFEARTLLADFFRILLGSFHTVQDFAHFLRQHVG